MQKFLNFFSLYFSFFVRIISGLAVLPFFSRHLNNASYNQLLIEISFSTWVLIVVEFGFNLTGTRSITMAKNDNEIMDINSNILGVKSLILLFLILIYFIINAFFVRLSVWSVFFAFFQSTLPYWYYQARDKLQTVSIYEASGRLLQLVSVLFMFQLNINGYEFYFISGTAIFLVLSVFLSLNMLKIHRPNVTSINLHSIGSLVRSSFQIFMFNTVTSIYTTATTFILGLLHVPNLSSFGNGDKIYKTSLSIFQPINQLVFPKAVKQFAISNKEGFKFIAKITPLLLIGSLIYTFFIILLSSRVVYILFGNKYPYSNEIVTLLCLSIPFSMINNILGYYIILANNLDKILNSIYIIISLVSMTLMFVFIPSYGILGMAWIIVFSEFIASISMGTFIFQWLYRKSVYKGVI